MSASKLTLSWLNLARAKRLTNFKVKHVHYCIQTMTTRYVVAQKSSSASRRKPDIHRTVFGLITTTNAGLIYISYNAATCFGVIQFILRDLYVKIYYLLKYKNLERN